MLSILMGRNGCERVWQQKVEGKTSGAQTLTRNKTEIRNQNQSEGP